MLQPYHCWPRLCIHTLVCTGSSSHHSTKSLNRDIHSPFLHLSPKSNLLNKLNVYAHFCGIHVLVSFYAQSAAGDGHVVLFGRDLFSLESNLKDSVNRNVKKLDLERNLNGALTLPVSNPKWEV